jgi:hypothetical protein
LPYLILTLLKLLLALPKALSNRLLALLELLLA